MEQSASSSESPPGKQSGNASRRKPKQPKGGSRKGIPNRATADVRSAIALIAQKNVNKLDGWLTRIGREDPARAMELYLRMIEYHIPKLTRTEIVKPPNSLGRVIDSSQLTQEQRQQLREMILALEPEPALLEQQQPNMLEPVGLAEAQVVEVKEE